MKDFSNNIFTWSKNNLANVLVGVVLLAGIGLRLSLYGDMRFSIGTNDSSSYYTQANISLFSWEAFTARRLPSYPVFFNFFEPIGGYEKPLAISYPAAPGVGTRHKVLDENYVNIVTAQAWISIFAWSIFIILLCRRLKTKILRPIAAIELVLFAFSPSLAEWDSILMSESLSFSLFAILAITTLELLFRVSEEKQNPGVVTKVLFPLWAVIVPAWAFTRDSNANTLIILVVFFILFLIIPKIRQQIPIYWIIGLTVWVVFLAYWYSTTTFAANRWVWGWFDIFNHWISGYPARLKFFTDHGMPIPWTDEWVKMAGSKTYLLFLINHPGFMVTELLGRMSDAFSENVQPFFYTYPTLLRQMILAVGDLFHPLSSIAFLFPLFSGLLIIITAIRNSFSANKSWFWFTLWILSMIYGLFMASFFGDSGGLIRHTLGAVVFMRLMIWLFPIILAEIISENKIQ